MRMLPVDNIEPNTRALISSVTDKRVGPSNLTRFIQNMDDHTHTNTHTHTQACRPLSPSNIKSTIQHCNSMPDRSTLALPIYLSLLDLIPTGKMNPLNGKTSKQDSVNIITPVLQSLAVFSRLRCPQRYVFWACWGRDGGLAGTQMRAWTPSGPEKVTDKWTCGTAAVVSPWQMMFAQLSPTLNPRLTAWACGLSLHANFTKWLQWSLRSATSSAVVFTVET